MQRVVTRTVLMKCVEDDNKPVNIVGTFNECSILASQNKVYQPRTVESCNNCPEMPESCKKAMLAQLWKMV